MCEDRIAPPGLKRGARRRAKRPAAASRRLGQSEVSVGARLERDKWRGVPGLVSDAVACVLLPASWANTELGFGFGFGLGTSAVAQPQPLPSLGPDPGTRKIWATALSSKTKRVDIQLQVRKVYLVRRYVSIAAMHSNLTHLLAPANTYPPPRPLPSRRLPPSPRRYRNSRIIPSPSHPSASRSHYRSSLSS